MLAHLFASALRPARPVRSTSVAAGPPSSTGFSPTARPGARAATAPSSSASRTPTRTVSSRARSRRSVEILRWFGLDWDEGPDKGGPLGPYIQSQRTDIYQEARPATDRRAARPTAASARRERLQAVREDRQTARPCRARLRPLLPRPATGRGPARARRRACPSRSASRMPREGETLSSTTDSRRDGLPERANLEDLILLKSDGFPTYHLANVVDDHLMEITHIMRGDEWIATAPIHVQLYEAFGWDAPQFAHMPLILAPGGGKLSKRHGSTAMEEFRGQGYLPEALMNYLALLGWSLDAHDRDPLEGRPAPELHARAGQPIPRHLRLRQAALVQPALHQPHPDGGGSGPAGRAVPGRGRSDRAGLG